MSVSSRAEQAELHLRRGELEASALAWEAAAVETPQGQGTYALAASHAAQAARARLALGQLRRAHTLAQRWLALAPDTDPVASGLLTVVLASIARWRADPAQATALLRGLEDAHASASLQIDVLHERARIALATGSPTGALAFVEAASELADAAGDLARLGETRLLDAEARLVAGAWPAVVAATGSLARQARAAGDPWTEGRALTLLGAALVEQRDYRRAQPTHTAALRLHQQTGHRPGAAASTGGLALCHLGLGAPAQGAQLLNQAIRLCAVLEDPAAEAAWRVQLDRTLVTLERAELRIQELLRFVEVVRALGDEAWEAALLRNLGEACREILDHERALGWYTAALASSERRQDLLGQSLDLTEVGRTLLTLGKPDEARGHLLEALKLPVPPDAPHLALARTALDQVQRRLGAAEPPVSPVQGARSASSIA
jgi:tetratricopeptide (TPR) repeat protein